MVFETLRSMAKNAFTKTGRMSFNKPIDERSLQKAVDKQMQVSILVNQEGWKMFIEDIKERREVMINAILSKAGGAQSSDLIARASMLNDILHWAEDVDEEGKVAADKLASRR